MPAQFHPEVERLPIDCNSTECADCCELTAQVLDLIKESKESPKALEKLRRIRSIIAGGISIGTVVLRLV